MRSSWPLEWLRFGLVVAAAAIAGALTIGTAWGLALGLGALLGWHLWQLYRLERWFRVERTAIPPEGTGVWGALFDHYHHRQRRHIDRKRQLAAMLREFRKSTQAVPDGAVVLDAERRIVWCNQAARDLVGLHDHQDFGQHVGNLLRDPRLRERLAAHAELGPLEIESPRQPDRWLSLRLIPYGEDQRLLLIRDVTRLHRLERMRRDFVANASHELRSPLTVIHGYLESLADDPEMPADWRRPVAEMRRQTQRMTSIVDNLLELSRLETDEPDASREAVDLRGLSARIRDEAMRLQERVATIDVEIAPGTRLQGAEVEIYSALSNLVFNAARYTPPEGKIRIVWEALPAGSGRLSVIDTGIGIEARHIPLLTQRFYRVSRSRARRSGGSGLGLAIVKHVMQRHGGSLEIESEPGKGSRFSCVFPADRVLLTARPAATVIKL